jgi:site-specific DNA-methyltransferase (adenine-specific)
MDVMAGMVEKEFDLAIVDFPYGISVNMNAWRKSDTKSKKRTLKKWDSELPSQETFNNLFYVSKNQIIWGANHMIDRIRRNSQGWIFWDKCVAAGCTFSDGELAWTSFDRSLKKPLYLGLDSLDMKERSSILQQNLLPFTHGFLKTTQSQTTQYSILTLAQCRLQ